MTAGRWWGSLPRSRVDRIGRVGDARERRPPFRPTSHDVAREAQVSQATVSRTFSSPESVSEEAREKVLKAAAKLRYQPNAMARTLASRSSGIIGLVVPDESDYYQHVITLFTSALVTRDLQLLLFEYEIGSDVEHVLKAVQSYQLDALIVSAMILAPSQAAVLAESGIPVVLFNYHGHQTGVASVSVDAAGGMTALADHLVDTGHRNIVYVGGVRTSAADQERYRAAVERLADHGVACPYIEAGAFTYHNGLAVSDQILSLDPAPDAVMAASDSIAFGLMDGLRRAGRGVPEDISVTGFDGLPQAAWLSYSLTTVEQPLDLLVHEALELATGDPPVAENRTVAGLLAIRSTVADRRDPGG